MESWVRYSIAVYMGLLISGALARPPMSAPAQQPVNTPSVYHDMTTPDDTLPNTPQPKPTTGTDVSV